ncbi:putative cell wall hydrolase [Clostridioides difficile DA00065]|nr:putative cell wall hydrolase [Clostridioides difficile DA00065]
MYRVDYKEEIEIRYKTVAETILMKMETNIPKAMKNLMSTRNSL